MKLELRRKLQDYCMDHELSIELNCKTYLVAEVRQYECGCNVIKSSYTITKFLKLSHAHISTYIYYREYIPVCKLHRCR